MHTVWNKSWMAIPGQIMLHWMVVVFSIKAEKDVYCFLMSKLPTKSVNMWEWKEMNWKWLQVGDDW